MKAKFKIKEIVHAMIIQNDRIIKEWNGEIIDIREYPNSVFYSIRDKNDIYDCPEYNLTKIKNETISQNTDSFS